MTDRREKTLIIVKPDGIQRGFIGRIIARFERKGYRLVAMKFMRASKELLEQHYAHLLDKPLYAAHISYMQLGPVIPMVWEGPDVVRVGRHIIGRSHPMVSKPGNLRGELLNTVGRNCMHRSDSVASAQREIALWFSEEELFDYTLVLVEKWDHLGY